WSHGDLSHWNCFLDSAGRLCLIDYEEVGLYPPLYDWFHLTLKPSLLKPHCEFPEEALVKIAERFSLPQEKVLAWLWLYLLLEMCKDARRNRVLLSEKINREIRYKRSLWTLCQDRLVSP
ncbi:MAG: phosphotransferase, partial [Myxococcota bacterium]|nr:phosphotransferase [Myxococcota bacterium]